MTTFPKVVLACAASCLLFTAAHAQDYALQQGEVLAPGVMGRDARIQAREEARAAEIRRAWLESGHMADSRAAAPVIVAGKILTPTLNARRVPAAPAVRVKFQTGNPGLRAIYLYFYSNSASGQYIYVNYTLPYLANGPTEGTVLIQRPNSYGYGNSGAFSLYSAAGTWTLSAAYVYDRAGNYTYYGPTDLSGLFPSLTLNLVNAEAPDSVQPQITAGTILTPVIHKTTDPRTFIARLTVSDDVSGVAYYYVGGTSPDSNYWGQSNYTPSPVLSGNVKAYTFLGTNPKRGLWTITQVSACDLAGNCTYVSGDSDIMALFGTTTFRVRR